MSRDQISIHLHQFLESLPMLSKIQMCFMYKVFYQYIFLHFSGFWIKWVFLTFVFCSFLCIKVIFNNLTRTNLYTYQLAMQTYTFFLHKFNNFIFHQNIIFKLFKVKFYFENIMFEYFFFMRFFRVLRS